MKRPRTLANIEVYPKVRDFLNFKARNSIQTKTIYTVALSYFETFLSNSEYARYHIDTILKPLKTRIDVYRLLDNFVGWLMLREDKSNSNTKLSRNSITVYVAGVRSYLEKYDIDTSKFKKKVDMPKKYKRTKEPIDSQDIQTILLACTNLRLKVFILVLASCGARVNEILSLKNSDIDFDSNPTKIHIRAENTKTNQARDIWISDEASTELKRYMDSKSKEPNNLVFTKRYDKAYIQPINLYRKLLENFHNVLVKVEKDKRKEGQNIQRREISFHSMRTFVKTVIATQTNTDFSEYYLGHSYSTYWGKKERERRELYLKCMPYLTFLDINTVESVDRNYLSKLEQRDEELERLSTEMYNQMYIIDQLQKKIEKMEKNTS